MYLEVFYEISKCISDISEISIVGLFSDIKEIRIFDIRKSYFLDIKNYISWYQKIVFSIKKYIFISKIHFSMSRNM